uniref:Uncharacterized protein n=1 Tax=Fusarium oxysporum (strain Fo5176) TaxID=660025 RepID=A0A0D2XTU2_FUSOF
MATVSRHRSKAFRRRKHQASNLAGGPAAASGSKKTSVPVNRDRQMDKSVDGVVPAQVGVLDGGIAHLDRDWRFYRPKVGHSLGGCHIGHACADWPDMSAV